MKRPKPLSGFKKLIQRPAINAVVREPTAGGIVFRRSKTGEVEILLIQDSKDRWTIPKGHIEEGEKAAETARREIAEEVGLKDMKIIDWLGKINFRYRRGTHLVLMTTEIFLVEALGNTDKVRPEKWMNSLAWLKANDALEKIEYDDIGKLILLALRKIRTGT